KGASAQVDSQLRERRRGFRRRREALERIQSAAGELEHRIAEIESQDQRLHQFLARVGALTAALREHSESQPMPLDDIDDAGLLHLNLPASDEPMPVLLRHAQA